MTDDIKAQLDIIGRRLYDIRVGSKPLKRGLKRIKEQVDYVNGLLDRYEEEKMRKND